MHRMTNEAAVQVPETNIVFLFPRKPALAKSEVQEPESEYAKNWECVADGLYRYKPSEKYYHRPVVHDGRCAVIEAHKAWEAACCPEAEDFFPSHCGGFIEERALAHALRRMTPQFWAGNSPGQS